MEQPPATQETLLAPGKREVLFGLAYLPLHMFLIGELLANILWLANMLIPSLSLSLTDLNLLYLLTGTVFLMLAMQDYLKASFSRFLAFGSKNLYVFLAGYGMRLVLTLPIAIVMLFLLPQDLPNPNQEAIVSILNYHRLPTAFLAVVLAPIVEELLFRGAIFAPLHKRNRWLAYAVSSLSFALLHIISALLFRFDPTLFLTMLLYIPAGIALCWSYEKSGNIWTAIFLHALMNLLAISLAGTV